MSAKDNCPQCDREVYREINYGTGAGMTLNVTDGTMVCIVPRYNRAIIHG